MSVAYNDLTAAQKTQIQTLIKAQRDAAAALVTARKLILRCKAESAATLVLRTTLDSTLPIPRDSSIQPSVSPFSLDDYTGDLSALLEADLEVVLAAIEQPELMGLIGQAIGSENLV
jgi:hypothetical protein